MVDLEELKRLHLLWLDGSDDDAEDASNDIMEALPALISEVEELREALKPFVEFEKAMSAIYDRHLDTDGFYLINETELTVGAFRRARALTKGDQDALQALLLCAKEGEP